MTLQAPPLSLYLHFPWCVRKCPYCDFNSYTLNGALPEAAYLQALSRDLREQAAWPQVAGRTLTSIFMGGGTPSLFSPEAIGRVLDEARALIGFAPDIEITLEANPGTIERGRFAEYAAVGVNRVSLGAQSFGAQQLSALGRIHAAADTVRGAEELHAAGLDNFNLDLMYGLPQQDVAGARSDLRQALALAPAHISHYHLTHGARHGLRRATAAAARRGQRGADAGGVRRRSSPAPGLRTTKCRPMPAPAGSAATISTTGPSVIIWAWAPGRMASSRTPRRARFCAPPTLASRGATRPGHPWPSGPSPRPSYRSSS